MKLLGLQSASSDACSVILNREGSVSVQEMYGLSLIIHNFIAADLALCGSHRAMLQSPLEALLRLVEATCIHTPVALASLRMSI